MFVFFLLSTCATNGPYLKNVSSQQGYFSYLGMALLCSFLEHSSFFRSREPRSCSCTVFSMGLGSTPTAEAMGKGAGEGYRKNVFLPKEDS